jgi:hypothetical protein
VPEPPAPPPPAGGTDWPAQVTDLIVNLVDSVRDKTTGPATSVARGLVYGTLAAIVGSAALVVFTIMLVRFFDVVADVALEAAGIDKPGRSTWIAHALTGALFAGAGAYLWRKGTQAAAA